MVKRLLRKYGYPPDKQAIMAETVLEQGQLFADEWSERTIRMIFAENVKIVAVERKSITKNAHGAPCHGID